MDSDGVRLHETSGVRRSVWLLVVAIALIGVAVMVVVRPLLRRAAFEPAVSLATKDPAGANRETRPNPGAAPPGRSIGITRVVEFEMCGNDGLQARSSFAGQTGTCNCGVMDSALSNCTTYLPKAMQTINQYATTAKVKMVSNLYYPGYDADNKLSWCKDATTGKQVNMQNTFLPYIAKMNYRACNYAAQYGFKCADSFAQFMGADYDSNGDGLVDSDGLKHQAGETESAYVTRITTTLRSTIRDANYHFVSSTTSYDYIQSDNTHPTYYGSATIGLSLFGNGAGSGAPDFTASQIVGGKNPQWNKWGHERMGWALSVFNPATP